MIERVEVAPDPGDAVAFGDARLGVVGVPGFSVPSFVLALERNVVLNPDHPEFASLVTHGEVRPFPLDRRLLVR